MKIIENIARQVLLKNSSQRLTPTEEPVHMGFAEKMATKLLQKGKQNRGPSLRANIDSLPAEHPADPPPLTKKEKQAELLAHMGYALLNGLSPEQSPFPTFETPKNRINGTEIQITRDSEELFVAQVRLAELPPRQQHLIIRTAVLDDNSPQRTFTHAILSGITPEVDYQDKADKLNQLTLRDLTPRGRLAVAEYTIGHEEIMKKISK